MIKIITLVIVLNVNFLYAGAPPVDDKPLPPPPYSINNVKLITTKVLWKEENLKNFLPTSYAYDKDLKGGLTVFSSKKKQAYYPASGAFAWITLQNNDKLIFFSTYGKNKLIYRIMKRTYVSKVELGSNKVVIMNGNVNARTNIRKKNVITITAKVKDKCEPTESSVVYSSKATKRVVYSPINMVSKKSCEADVNNIKFESILQGLNVSKVLETKVYDDANISYLAPKLK